ncbi:TonB-dependent receptor [Hyphococcus flavus]|uniref:TonB-dependent receptor n=1 Tax=Hyphococcus flavus TaxID=1866326 RepID=A0AAF0CHR5_9PROT|nr:TonB-dependent receptor [Hyphococcus flavus]WDI32202.1 TonB-dependent receptor [Hyphococcus flavus]
MKNILLTGAGVLALNGAALAQDDGEIMLASAAMIEDEITVYATRNPIPAFDYPGQVTVIEKDVIDDFNPSTLSDIFDAVPGSNFSSGPRRTGDTPDVRGLSGEGVLVLFDGARQSFLSGHDGRFFIDPDLVRAVEVVRGPTSALYGSGALGGVIAMRTITADDLLEDGETAGVKVGAGFQSVNDEARITGTGVWRSADEVVDVVGNFTHRNSGDIELGNGLELPADDEILSSLLKTTIRPNDEWTLSAQWIRYGGDSVDPSNPQGNNTAGPGNENVQRDIDSNTIQGSINFNPASTNLIDANLVGYFTRNNVTEDEVDSTRIVTREVETIGISFDNRSRFDFSDAASLTLTYGGEYYRDEQIGRDNMTADGTRGGVPDATSDFYGAFVQGELALSGSFGVFTVIPGIRWDRFENEAPGDPSTKDEAFSPKVGVSYKPVPELIIFGNWAEAFRAPSFNEIYADNVHFQIPNLTVPGPFGPFGPPAFVTNFFVPNPDLVPEESQTWEVGAGVDFDNVLFNGDSFTAKGSYYQSDVDNLIDLEVNIPFTCFLTPDELFPGAPPCGSGEAFGNFSRNVNVTNAEIDGFELEAQYDAEYFYIRGNYSTIDGEDADTGDFVGVLSPSTVFLDGGIKWPQADFRIGARVVIAEDFDKVNDIANARDGYTVGDVYAVWEPSNGALEGLRIDLGVDNVTDTDYEVVAAGVSQPGLNFKAAISWRQGF